MRAGQLIGSAAIPFALFLMGMVAMELVNRSRRRPAEQVADEAEI
jgi:hypothetical protein